MMLCDAADVSGGKLYILGGGWDQLVRRTDAIALTFAAVLSIPWQLTNRRLNLELSLLNADGDVVEDGDGEPVMAAGDITIGRPPHVRPGASQNVPLTTPFKPLGLRSGGYLCTLAIDGKVHARCSFNVVVQGEAENE